MAFCQYTTVTLKFTAALSQHYTMYNTPIIPDDFELPDELLADQFKLRPLTIDDVDLDYEAVMSSEYRLRNIFRENGEWPNGLTIEQNRIELGWHQVEFQERTSFAYTMVEHDESRVLGCMYIYPTRKADYDVEVTMWVRESHAELDEVLFNVVSHWIETDWPFNNPIYPGRTITWEEWNNL